MNLNDLHKELIAAARSQLPGDRVPHTFEKRVMALLWARGLWRAALACLAFMLLLGTLVLATPPRNSPSNDLSQDFENTMLASMNQDTDSTFSR